MGEYELRAGAKIELIGPDDLRAEGERQRDWYQQVMREAEGETILHTALPFATDATGGTASLARGGAPVYRVPVGYDAYVIRCSVDYMGSDAATPVTCDVRLAENQNSPSALRSVTNQLPSVFAASRSHAPLFRSGSEVVVSITGGPVSTSISCHLQVVLTARRPAQSR